jgi:hypothetical protein
MTPSNKQPVKSNKQAAETPKPRPAPITNNPNLAQISAQRPWYQMKRYAFPVIALILLTLYSGVAINNQVDPLGAPSPDSDSTSTDSSITQDSSDQKPTGPTLDKQGVNPAAGSQADISSETENQKRARLDAKTYFESSWFSRVGMIDQLVFDGFSKADAAYGVDALGVDWAKEAEGTADAEIRSDWFSRQGLIDVLVYQGFTDAEATAAVDALGVDWFEEAAGKALDYLEYDFYTYEELVDQLIYDGFTEEEADYGASEAEA